MSTLLLRLAAPLQSWGVDSKFEQRRGTMREPTKSGVIGMIAAALGRNRDDPIDDLSALNFGVRIDQPGQILRDFHTARYKDDKPPYVTNRYYLSDAIFLAGLEGDYDFLQEIESAIISPIYPLYLGRRSCPPVGRISLGINDKSLENALLEESWQASEIYKRRTSYTNTINNLTLVIDSKAIGNLRRRDLPLSFSQKYKKYAYRYIIDTMISIPTQHKNETTHDAFDAIEKEV